MFSKKDLMNLESVIMLSAVDENSGKRKASAALNTSVDTINKYIDSLEGELGIKLLSSSEKGSSLTVNGRKVADLAIRIKEHLRDIYRVVPLDGDIKGEVQIIYDQNVRSNFVARDLTDFFEHSPDIQLIGHLVDGVPDMSDMKYDVCLSYGVPSGDDIVVIYSKPILYGFFASAKYLARYKYPVDLDDMLNNHRMVLTSSSAQRIKEGKEFLRKARRISYLSNSAYATYEVIRSGGGIGLMPLSFASEGLVCLDNIKSESTATIYLTAHRSTKDIPKIRVILDYYKELIKRI